ncbi:MAG: S-layer homology domain-containing protein [Acidimicrobiales bacterium]|nr:S-layer homology domain-containing protein [Acidimicrobiales bacterium]
MSQHSFATSLRRRIAIVMAAMLALTLVPLAGPAGAQPAPAPDISTCDDAPDAGFTDTAGTGFETEIDCLAAFGVTTGTTATTYSPAVQVRRSQMALFYYRVGTAAGLTWDTSDAGFTDLAGLDADFVDAINALANAGIVQGTSATEFSPQDRIRRSQMALFIDRFQEELTGFAYSDGFTGDDLFPDISTLDAEARLAVNGIGSVGISQGDASGNYVPSGFVSRQQMAAFIVRHLVDNGFEVPGADVSGVIIEAYDPTPGAGNPNYIFSTGDEVVEVEVGDDPTFMVTGVPATETVFGASAQLGAMVTYNEDADTHDVTPQDVLAAGFTVGYGLDLTGPTTNLIEPYSGVEMGFLADPDDNTSGTTVLELDNNTSGDAADAPVYRVGNNTVTYAVFEANISFGDTLTVENYDDGDADTDVIYRLQNGDISGGADVVDATDDPILMTIETNEWNVGNDLAGASPFQLDSGEYTAGTQRFSADGTPYNLAGIGTWLDDAIDGLGTDDYVRVTYTRSSGVEDFAFTVVEADEDDEAEAGSITGTYVGGTASNGTLGGAAGSFDILVDGDVVTVEVSMPDAGILVDGVITSVDEIAGAIDAGASVTVMVEDDGQLETDPVTASAGRRSRPHHQPVREPLPT